MSSRTTRATRKTGRSLVLSLLCACTHAPEAPASVQPKAPVVSDATQASKSDSKSDAKSGVETEPKLDPLPRCAIKQRARVDVDHDGKLDTLLWTRCGADYIRDVDGKPGYPKDTFVITTATGTIPVYDNLSRSSDEYIAEISIVPLSAKDERVLLKVIPYVEDSGQQWQLIDIQQGSARRWLAPPLKPQFARLLGAHEKLGKQGGPTLTVTLDCLEVAHQVYREDDEDCCPSGGQVRACLVLGHDGLQVSKAWRVSQ